MKKSLIQLLIIAIICLIFSGVIIRLSITEASFSITEQFEEDFDEVDKDSPGAGWYFLIFGGMAFTADIFLTFVYIVILGIPILILIIMVILQSIAILIQIGKQKKWKNTTGKVLTIISIVLQILVCVDILLVTISGFMLNRILLFLVLVLNIISVVLFIIELRTMGNFSIDTEVKPEVVE